MESSSVLRVFMAECGFSFNTPLKDSCYEAIGTDGLISCIGFSGYDFRSRSGFLAHFSSPLQVEDFYNRAVVELEKRGIEDGEFHCKIVGGYKRAKYSKEIVARIKDQVDRIEGIFFSIDEEDGLAETPFQRSLLLNLRSGEWESYTPSLEDRVLLPFEEERYGTVNKFI